MSADRLIRDHEPRGPRPAEAALHEVIDRLLDELTPATDPARRLEIVTALRETRAKLALVTGPAAAE